MNDILEFLQQRNSAARLTEPAPTAGEFADMLRAAMRVPDHAWLRPWRFISIAGERRAVFGEALERSLLLRDQGADEAARAKARNSPLRAPLVVVVVARLCEHPKVPHSEQRLSAGCAAYGLLLAAEALGYAGIWRTGAAAFDRTLMSELGLDDNEEITGFLFLGTSQGPRKPLPVLEVGRFLSRF
jgi:nitroreductase